MLNISTRKAALPRPTWVRLAVLSLALVLSVPLVAALPAGVATPAPASGPVARTAVAPAPVAQAASAPRVPTGLDPVESATLAAAGVPLQVAQASVARASQPTRVFLGYWAKWGNDSRPEASLSANLSRVDLYAPYWYTLRADGTIGSRESGHGALTDKVHAAGRKVIPLINKSSDNTPLTDPSIRHKAVQNIYDLLVANGYDGVNIDFEGMPSWTRSGLTAFMRELADKLRPAGLLVTMAVPAKWSSDDSTNDFAACFDYAALGKIVDYLVIMTYDQHADWSGPGPVAGVDWVERVIRYATGVVPSQKILLGLAGYGYDWSSAGCANVEAWRAPGLAANYGADIQWDDTAKAPHFTYWTSSGTRHDVWYENSYSVDLKVALANDYNLGGVALWALGMEDERFWQVIRGAAGNSGGLGSSPGATPGGSEVPSSAGSGGATSALPGGGGGGASSGAAGLPPGQPFADVPPSHWASATIASLAAAGVVQGVDATHFQPDLPVSRAEFAALLARALKLAQPSASTPSFRDVTPTAWYHDAVARAVAWGYMVGVGERLFGPGTPLTRQEAAAILVRVRGDLTLGSATGGASAPFSDISAACPWAAEAVRLATLKGLLGGYPDGTFRPLREVTRAEAAAIVSRLVQ